MSFYGGFPEYVSVAERKKKAERTLKKLTKKGKVLTPVQVTNKKLVTSALAKAWCSHIETEVAYCESRLSRGRSYLRHGSVLDVKISQGKINAIVSGSEIYKIEIKIKFFTEQKLQLLKNLFAQNPEYAYQLFNGNLSEQLLDILTDEQYSIFPCYRDFDFNCKCYDFHGKTCKHIAAVLYAIGVIIDTDIRKLFLLRNINYEDLLTAPSINTTNQSNIIDDSQLANLFGIELQSL